MRFILFAILVPVTIRMLRLNRGLVIGEETHTIDSVLDLKPLSLFTATAKMFRNFARICNDGLSAFDQFLTLMKASLPILATDLATSFFESHSKQ